MATKIPLWKMFEYVSLNMEITNNSDIQADSLLMVQNNNLKNPERIFLKNKQNLF